MERNCGFHPIRVSPHTTPTSESSVLEGRRVVKPDLASRGASKGSGGLFDRTPFIVFWEMTQACDLVCQHCRAHAQATRDPMELTTEEGRQLLRDAKAMGAPVVVLTGGDPAKRADLVSMVRYGNELGLRMALTPSATPLVTKELLQELKDAGLARLAVSLDGHERATHDAFRGVGGSFDRTFEILEQAHEVGLTTQINTTVTQSNRVELPLIAKDIERLNIELWSVFFVVPMGRATGTDLLDPYDVEVALHLLAELSETSPFDIKTTAAPHFRRVLLERKVNRQEVSGIKDGINRAPRGVNDGQGILFVSRTGDIYPSGFMPIHCGNVREDGLADVYRDHPLFNSLRDPDQLKGKCGACPFRQVCGGSRARSYAIEGDPLASEPACAYVPKGYVVEDSGPRHLKQV